MVPLNHHFAPAAARRPWTHVSESIWGLPLPWPLPVIALGGFYPPNELIGHSPIVWHLQKASLSV